MNEDRVKELIETAKQALQDKIDALKQRVKILESQKGIKFNQNADS